MVAGSIPAEAANKSRVEKWSSRQPHALEIVGSNPTPATKKPIEVCPASVANGGLLRFRASATSFPNGMMTADLAYGSSKSSRSGTQYTAFAILELRITSYRASYTP
jgi:hypothetical protein